MTTHDDTSITRSLRVLDAADRVLDETQGARAAATLERILATDPEHDPGPDAPTPTAGPSPTPRRRAHRLLLGGGLVAAATTAAVAVPLVTGGEEAFASWSPTPIALTGAERTAAVDACLVLQGDHDGELAFDPDADPSVLIAEARGGWSYVVFTIAGRSGDLEGSCLVPDDLVADPRPDEGGFFGGMGSATETAGTPPARDVARETVSGFGSVDGDLFAYAEGLAGAEVERIDVTTPGGTTVEASVDNGRWAVWWPAGDDAMDNPEITGAPAYEITLRDGTVTDDLDILG